MQEILGDASLSMEEGLAALQKSLAGIRTGRADPRLVEGVKVEAYGASMPINQVATVVAEGATTIKITPWDKSQLSFVEKAILLSDIGVQPSSDGHAIRLNLPPMTEERRQEYVKLARSCGEKAKISIRSARRDSIDQVKLSVKEKLLTEDDEHRINSEIQKLTDNFVEQVDKIVAAKEQELLKV